MSDVVRKLRQDRRLAFSATGWLLAIVLSVLPVLAAAAESPRDRYLQALKALSSDRLETSDPIAESLKDYPLYPYLELARIAHRIDREDTEVVVAALEKHDGMPPARRLRTAWLRRLAREKRWDQFITDFRRPQGARLSCQYAAARIQRDGALEFESRLWTVGRSQPDECDPVFAHWQRADELTAQRYLERAILAVQQGESKLARFLARKAGAGPAIERWLALRANPGRELLNAVGWEDSDLNRRMVLDTLDHIKSRRNSLARRRWPALRDHYGFTENQVTALERDLALYYSTDYPDDALDQLRALPPASRDQQIVEWMVRVALKTGDWAAVLDALQQMPPAFATRDRWLYWRARALEQLDRKAQADAVYQTLSERANYFGFLAADRLGARYALCPRPRDPDAKVLAGLTARPAMRRALELAAIGHWPDARSEWNTAVAGLSREQRRQAAILAASEGWHGRAVLTLADTGHRERYQLRFPLAWKTEVEAAAAANGLNPSLVYSVMRSESALVVDAASGANAHGLMQLTPQTAREVAEAIGMPRPTLAALRDPKINLRLGSAYLRQLFARFENPLLVLAAYNAGPDAVERWRKLDLPPDPDRWIESLPYYETRDYVMRVLAFATIYDWRREGKMIALAHRTPATDTRPGVTDLGLAGRIVPRCADASAVQTH